MQAETLKKMLGQAALEFVPKDAVIGVGTGTTVHHFIQALATIKQRIEGAVASSEDTAAKLKALNIPVYDLNSVDAVPVYIDGADEATSHGALIKGGGGAHTREKILATVAKKFICMIDQSKKVDVLGRKAPVPIEVMPMARGYVAREVVRLGGEPVYREGFKTDNGNIILDVFNLALVDPKSMEEILKSITGVVETGIFAKRSADVLLIASEEGVHTVTPGNI